MSPPLLAARALTKRFGAVTALEDVDLEVRPGEVHAVLGENGAGKSTLMNLVFGRLAPDAGRLEWRGVPVEFASPRDPLALGIGMVHQHFMLVDALTVAENVALADPRQSGFALDPARTRARVEELAARHRLALDPEARCGDLPVGARQRVEIAKALARDVSLLILDEPTAVLAPAEVDDLFTTVRRLVADGTAVLFISHKLDEVLALADRITVLRGGRVAARVARGEADAAALAHAIVGGGAEVRGAPRGAARGAARPGEVVLEARRILRRAHGEAPLRDVSFALRAGEILGVAGVDGNGQDELVAVLAGLARVEAGAVLLDGRDVTDRSVAERWRLGLSVLPSDRGRDGLVPDAALWENLALREFDAPWARGPFGVSPRRHERRAAALLERFDVRAPGPRAAARTLSGGNQQKLLLARELAHDPRVLVLANPTRGLDVGAAASLLGTLAARRDQGCAVLLASTELDELLAHADRIAVMFGGRWIEAPSADRGTVGALMLGATP